MPELTTVLSGLRNTLAGFVLALPCFVWATEEPWALEQEEDDIQIYTRAVAGSPFLEVKATALINAPIEHVAAVMGDGQSCSEWRARCKSSEVLGTPSDTERTIYMVLDMPWPVEDRDMVIHSTIEIDRIARTVTVQLGPAPSNHPEQGYVRATTTGQYEIKGLDEEQVFLTYIMHTDLGGDLSANLANPRVIESTYEDVKRLQTLAEQ
jgi:START domain-containing protein